MLKPDCGAYSVPWRAEDDERFVAAELDEPGWWAVTHPDVERFLVAYFSAEFALHQSLPIYAGGLGVLAGDLVYTWLALRLMKRTGRTDVTAMPFGIDTPTLFAMVCEVESGRMWVAPGDPRDCAYEEVDTSGVA